MPAGWMPRRTCTSSACGRGPAGCSRCLPTSWTTGPRITAAANLPGQTWKRSSARRCCSPKARSPNGVQIVTHDPLPAVCGEFEILAKVLHHLIRNAIEYGGTSPRAHFIQQRRCRLDLLRAGQRPRYRACIPRPSFRGVQAPARQGIPRERTRTGILQEGHGVARRPNVAGIGAWVGVYVLFHRG